MFEFSRKEIRKEFNATKYGKKTNTYLYVFAIITIICIITCFVVPIFIENELLTMLLEFISTLSLFSVCYFDGKRDGAIEQFKRSKQENTK